LFAGGIGKRELDESCRLRWKQGNLSHTGGEDIMKFSREGITVQPVIWPRRESMPISNGGEKRNMRKKKISTRGRRDQVG